SAPALLLRRLRPGILSRSCLSRRCAPATLLLRRRGCSPAALLLLLVPALLSGRRSPSLLLRILSTPAALLLLLVPTLLSGRRSPSLLLRILSTPAALLLLLVPTLLSGRRSPSLLLRGIWRAPAALLLSPLIISRHTCSLRIPLSGAGLTRLPAGGTGSVIFVILLFLSTATEEHECHPQNNDRYN